jgi:hypothetical protein
MSEYIHKPNTGSMFPNGRKKEPQQPDLTGKIFLTKELMQECMDATPDGELVVWMSAPGITLTIELACR